MKKRDLLILLSLFSPFALHMFAQQDNQTTVRFVNTGKMAVAGTGKVYIPDAVSMTGNNVSVNVASGGVVAIGGNFYFTPGTGTMANDNLFTAGSAGTIKFIDKDAAAAARTRTIHTKATNFDKGKNYIAFPNILIDTKDQIALETSMGIDALTLKRTAGKTGTFLLKSALEAGKVYDASLRITGKKTGNAGVSADFVTAGAVIIEREITPYRAAVGANVSDYLIGFASPYTNQRSGYFAGNYVRKMLPDANGHIQYPWGDTPDPADPTIIDKNIQYLTKASDRFVGGEGYIIELRPRDFDYLSIPGGFLETTGGNNALYNITKFTFNGKPFNLPSEAEQLFADDAITRSSKSSVASGKTHNWVIGNSYTAPISIEALLEAMGNSSIKFATKLYLFSSGSVNGYLTYNISSGTMNPADFEYISPMSIFMIRTNKKNATETTFSITKDMLTHGKSANYGMSRASVSKYDNEVVFRVSPEDTPGVFDLAGIGLRSGGNPNTDSKDEAKTFSKEDKYFSLYSVASDGQKLYANIMPDDVKTVKLCFNPGKVEGTFHLQTSRMESLRTAGLWLEDLKENKLIDLFETDGEYIFDAEEGDFTERFLVHFYPAPTKTDDVDSNLDFYYNGNSVVVKGILVEDIGSKLVIVDMQGRVLCGSIITNTSDVYLNIDLAEGVYIARLEGKRTKTKKFVR